MCWDARDLSYDPLQMSRMLVVTPDLRKAVSFDRDWKPGQVRIRSPYEEQWKVVCDRSWGGVGIQELDYPSVCYTGHSEQNSEVMS